MVILFQGGRPWQNLPGTLFWPLDLPWNVEITFCSHSVLFASVTRALATFLATFLVTHTKQSDLPAHPLERSFLWPGAVFFILFPSWHIMDAQIVGWIDRLDRWMNRILFLFFSFFKKKSIIYYINSKWMFSPWGEKQLPNKVKVLFFFPVFFFFEDWHLS